MVLPFLSKVKPCFLVIKNQREPSPSLVRKKPKQIASAFLFFKSSSYCSKFSYSQLLQSKNKNCNCNYVNNPVLPLSFR